VTQLLYKAAWDILRDKKGWGKDAMAKRGLLDLRHAGRAAALGALVALVGCTDPDPEHIQSRRDFESLTNRRAPEPKAAEAPPIPELQPLLAAPPAPGVEQRLVSISVTDPNIPVRDVLLELARKVGVDLDLDPRVSGGVIITARDRPFLDVVDRICEQDDLRFSFKNGVLKVEPDTLYYQTYHLDILNTIRTMTTDIGSSLNLSQLIQGGGASGGQNTSTTDVKGTSLLDTWKDIDDNVKSILTNSSLKGAAPPVQQVAVIPAPVVPPAAAAPAADGSPAAAAAQYAAQTAAAGRADAAPPLPAAGAAAAAAAAPAGAGTTPLYSINKQAGVLSVYGTSKQQKLIQAYLEKVVAKIGAQVLIEAKVVEIALTDQYNAGVDWQSLRQNLKGTGFGLSSLTPSTNPSAAIPNLPVPYKIDQPFGNFGLNAGFTTFGGDLAAMVNLVKSYGDVRTLASPRLTVMNNQPATLKVAENHVYFKLQATVTSTPATTGSAASQTATYNSQLQTLPIGLVMTVLPAIDTEHGTITLGLRPSVTAWPGTTVSDPAVSLSIASACGGSSVGACSPANIATAVAAASVPVVDIREMESVVTIPSGSVVVLGGLMQEVINRNDSGVPGAADVPILGNLFKATSDSTQLTELVIFIKATLVKGPGDTVQWGDKDTYKNYFRDDRPLAF